MRLVYSDPLIEIELDYLIPTRIRIENQKMFSTFVGELWNQCNGGSGGFILSEVEKELSLAKKATFVINPFEISCNEKKIVTSIYSELNEISNEDFQQRLLEINANIISLFDSLTLKLPYDLTFNLELDTAGLFKLYNMKIVDETDEIIKRIISYVRLSHQALGTEVFFFMNLKHFLEEKDLELLFEACRYEHVFVINIEGGGFEDNTLFEKCVIIDKDQCIINLN